MIFRMDKAGSRKGDWTKPQEQKNASLQSCGSHTQRSKVGAFHQEPPCFLRLSVTSSQSPPAPALLGSGLGIKMCTCAVHRQFNSSEPIRTHCPPRAESLTPRDGGIISPFANPRSPVLRTGRMLFSQQAAHWDE